LIDRSDAFEIDPRVSTPTHIGQDGGDVQRESPPPTPHLSLTGLQM
jgi:hypothetical protein